MVDPVGLQGEMIVGVQMGTPHEDTDRAGIKHCKRYVLALSA